LALGGHFRGRGEPADDDAKYDIEEDEQITSS